MVNLGPAVRHIIQEKNRKTNEENDIRAFLNSSYIFVLSSTKQRPNDQILRCVENVNHEGKIFQFLSFRIYRCPRFSFSGDSFDNDKKTE